MALLKTGSTHCHFNKVFGDVESLIKLKECGFDSCDFALNSYQREDAFDRVEEDYILMKSDAEMKEYFTSLKKVADDIGLEIGQVHAPYHFCPAENFFRDDFIKCYQNAVKATAFLGSKDLVVHPIVLPDPENNYKKNLKMNAEFYGSLRSVMKEYGVRVSVENMDAINPLKKSGVPSTVSSAEKVLDLLDLLGDGYCACLDTGHAFLAGQEPGHMAKLLGDKLGTLHIHDGDGYDDLHIPPMTGYIKWEQFFKALADIDYKGYVNIEIDYLRFGRDKEVMLSLGRFMNTLARNFAQKIEDYKK